MHLQPQVIETATAHFANLQPRDLFVSNTQLDGFLGFLAFGWFLYVPVLCWVFWWTRNEIFRRRAGLGPGRYHIWFGHRKILRRFPDGQIWIAKWAILDNRWVWKQVTSQPTSHYSSDFSPGRFVTYDDLGNSGITGKFKRMFRKGGKEDKTQNHEMASPSVANTHSEA